ncbi:RtcB family protein, partial [Leptospira gomenensis]
LHSGSRNIGKTLAEHHIAIARGLIHNETLPDKDLAVFLSGTSEMREYARDLAWAQQYAYLNRVTMMELYKNAIKRYIPHMETTFDVICHHNYVSEETHFGEDVIVTRKGAISARNGEYGIIPGSMGAKSFIVKGLGNPDSFHSASHGAGRRLSRNKAKAHFSVEDLEKQTHGVECRKDLGVLDEIPGAYKDIIQVMKYQESLVSIVAELKQVMCVKG